MPHIYSSDFHVLHTRARRDQRNGDAMTTDPPAACLPATIAWSATEADAYGEPPLPDPLCIQLAVLDGERHIYRLHRKMLMQLHGRISRLLAKASAPLEDSRIEELEGAKDRILAQAAE